MDIKKQSFNGAIWTFTDILINKGAYFITTLVLAGILGPKEFGLIGMIMLFVSIGNTLIDSGMSTSLLRSNNITDNEYSTVFITNILMSFLVYLIIFLLAPFIATFYEQPVLIDVIKWYCLGFVITSFRSIHNVKLMKELEFRKITILNLPGIIISVIVGIWMGYNGYGIWSLVSLFLINQIISTFLFWSFINWRPSFYFDFANYKDHFKFGYKLTLSALLNTAFENIYNIIIGKFYNVKILGFYERAYTFNNYPVSVLSGIILKVSLPSLTLIKDDSERLHNAYKNIMQLAFFLAASGLCFIALLARQFVSIILGEQWLDIVPIFQILCLSFIFYPIHSLNINILSVFGRSDLFLKLEVIKKITILLVIAVCFNYGLMGLVWSSVVNSILGLFINTYYSGKFLNYPTLEQFRDLLPTILVVFTTGGVVYSFLIIFELNVILQLFVSFVLGLITIIAISEIIKPKSTTALSDLPINL